MSPARDFAVKGKCWVAPDGLHLDVRGLSPPTPMVAILKVLSAMAQEGTLIVHHDREPVLLYPALAEAGWRAEHVTGDPGEVRLRIERSA